MGFWLHPIRHSVRQEVRKRGERTKAVDDLGENHERFTINEVRTENEDLDALRSFLIRKAPAVAAEAMFIHALGAVEGRKRSTRWLPIPRDSLTNSTTWVTTSPFAERMISAAAKVRLTIIVDKTGAKIVKDLELEGKAIGAIGDKVGTTGINDIMEQKLLR